VGIKAIIFNQQPSYAVFTANKRKHKNCTCEKINFRLFRNCKSDCL